MAASIETMLKHLAEHPQHKDKILLEMREVIHKMRPFDQATRRSIFDKVRDIIRDPILSKEVLFDIGLDYHGQTLLQEMMIRYLKNEIQQHLGTLSEEEQKKYKESPDYENRMKVIKEMEEDESEKEGECVGLSTLWAYGKRIEDESDIDHKKLKDDLTFFNRVWKTLVLRHEKQELSLAEKRDIERFIANVRQYQLPSVLIGSELAISGEQLDLSASLSDTRRGTPVEAFKQRISMSKDLLRSRLAQIVKPKSMIFLGTEGHMMSIYQATNGKLYFYDPNSPEGEVVLENIEQLTTAVWDRSHPQQFRKGMAGFDPLDQFFRKDVLITVYKFSSDPLYSYPTAEQFKPSVEEFIKLASEIPLFITLAHRPQIKSLVESLDDLKVIEILQREDVPVELKKMLIEQAVMYPEKRTALRARYILKRHPAILTELEESRKGIDKTRFEKFKKSRAEFEILSKKHIDLDLDRYTLDDLLKVKEALDLEQVFHILYKDEHMGDRKLAEELLKSCLEENPSILMYAVLEENIKRGNLELAQEIASIVMERFKLGLPIAKIIELRSPDFAEFMRKKYGDRYVDAFGKPQLELVPRVIQNELLREEKKKIIDKITDLFIQNKEQRSQEAIDLVTKEALAIQESLTVEEALLVVSLHPGNLELTQRLLAHCQKDSGRAGLMLFSVLKENIDSGFLGVAKEIVKISAERFGLIPSLKTIEEIGNEEFSKFISDNYQPHYTGQTVDPMRERESKEKLEEDERELKRRADLAQEEQHRIALNESRLEQNLVGIDCRSLQSTLQREGESARNWLKTIQDRIAFRVDRFSPLHNMDETKAQVEYLYQEGRQYLNQRQEGIQKELMDVLSKTKIVLKKAEDLAGNLPSSRRIEMDRMIEKLRLDLSQLEQEAKLFSEQIDAVKRDLSQIAEKAYSDISRKVKRAKESNVALRDLSLTVTQNFSNLRVEMEKEIERSKNELEKLKRDITAGILEGKESVESYLNRIAAVLDRIQDLGLEQIKKAESLESEAFKKIGELESEKSIDRKLKVESFKKIRQSRQELTLAIQSLETEFEPFVEVAHNQLRAAKQERNRQHSEEFDKQRAIEWERVKAEIQAREEKEEAEFQLMFKSSPRSLHPSSTDKPKEGLGGKIPPRSKL